MSDNLNKDTRPEFFPGMEHGEFGHFHHHHHHYHHHFHHHFFYPQPFMGGYGRYPMSGQYGTNQGLSGYSEYQ